MQLSFIRTPWFFTSFFKKIIWNKPNNDHSIFLTFDDGPHPKITPWLLELLQQKKAKATFFCLGEQAEKYPQLIQQIVAEGHTLGNHGYKHLDGWKINYQNYIDNAEKGKAVLEAIVQQNIKWFRPPYGKFRNSNIGNVVLWSLMPRDFDQSISKEKCLKNIQQAKSGDIIVLHDNEKSFSHLKYILPLFLEQNRKFLFQAF